MFLIPTYAFSHKVSGKIVDEQGNGIKYATIYIEELQTGTSANQHGMYAISLKPGTYNLSVRALGLSPTLQKVTVKNSNVKLDITLYQQSYILAGVTIRADNEDPAYSIMRNAVARAPGFANQVKSYTSEVYIKGAVKVLKMPRMVANRLEVNGEKPKEGETYVNESINRISFKAPNTYKQEVISVNTTFPLGDNEVPVIGLLSGSIYKSMNDVYISPFAANAFSHYKFEYEGLLQDGEFFINKIKVTPKRKSKLLMSGYLYIVDEVWCVYSYDVTLNPMFTKLRIKQFYAPVKGGNYLPVNMFAEADISVMGVKARGVYTSTIKYKNVVINPQFSLKNIAKQVYQFKPDTSTVTEIKHSNPKVEKIDEKLNELLSNNNPTNREVFEMQKLMSKKATILEEDGKENPFLIESNYQQIVNKSALNRDSSYWDSIRPIPASSDEKISYRKVEEKKAKEDSTSKFVKALKIASFGNYEWERSRKHYLFYPGIVALRNVGFNPVDGWQAMQHLKYRWNIDSLSRHIEIKGHAGYAFSREVFFGHGETVFKYKPDKNGYIKIMGGYGSRNFNNGYEMGTSRDLNMFYNLLLKENYVNLYHDTYINVFHNIELTNGLQLLTGMGYSKIDSLSNTTNFSILYPNDDYKPNIPENSEITTQNLSPREQIVYKIGFSYTPMQKYQMIKGEKHYRGSKLPTFWTSYTGNIPLPNDPTRFGKVNIGIKQHFDFYSISSLKYNFEIGDFIHNDNVHFSNFKHLKTYQEIFSTRRFNMKGFYLLKSYEYSTMEKYFEANAQYSNKYMLLKRLPILSNTMWDENIYASCLTVEGQKPYFELGYTLSEIMFAGEIGVFAGMKETEFHGVGLKAVFVFY